MATDEVKQVLDTPDMSRRSSTMTTTATETTRCTMAIDARNAALGRICDILGDVAFAHNLMEVMPSDSRRHLLGAWNKLHELRVIIRQLADEYESAHNNSNNKETAMSDNSTTKCTVCTPAFGKKSPWQSHFHKLERLFSGDPKIDVKQDENGTDIHFYVEGQDKFDAIQRVLGSGVDFGNVHVKYVYHIDNKRLGSVTSHDYETLFDGNGNVSRIVRGGNPVIGQQTYIVFTPAVVQWFDDNLLDIAGNRSTVMEDIAREVFTGSGMASTSFCTEAVG